MDPERHKALTGISNEVILDNLRNVLAVKEPRDVIIRIPVIPGCTDSPENISASARFVAELGFVQVELIPYHRFGVAKYEQYGMTYSLPDCEPISDSALQELRDIVCRTGLVELSAGASEPA